MRDDAASTLDATVAQPRPEDPLWTAASQQAATALAHAKADVGRRQEAVTVFGRLDRALREKNADAAARVLSDPKLKAALDTYPELRSGVDRVRLASQRATTGRVESLLRDVERYAKAKGWPCVRSEGGVRVAHLLWVKPDPSGSTKVQSKSVRTLSWDAVRPLIDLEHERVWGRAERRGPELAREVGEALEALSDEAGDAGYVRLRSVYNLLKSKLPKASGRVASYYRDEFSADLSVLLARQAKGGARPRFELSAARNSELAHEVINPDGELALAGYIRKR